MPRRHPSQLSTLWEFIRANVDHPAARLAISTLLSLLQSFLLVSIPFLFREAFDDGLARDRYWLFSLLSGTAALAYLGHAAITLIGRSYALSLTTTLTGQLRERLVDRVCSMPRERYVAADHGVVHSNLVNDSERVDRMLNALISTVFPALLLVAVMLTGLAVINLYLFLGFVVAFPVAYGLNRLISRRLSNSIKDYHRSFEAYSTGVEQLISFVDFVQAHGFEPFEVERNRRIIERTGRAKWDAGVQMTALNLANQTTVGVVTVFVLILGAFLVYSGRMTLGALLSFFAAATLLRSRIGQLSWAIPQVLEGYESFSTLTRFLETAERHRYTGRFRPKRMAGLALEGVSFSYGNDYPVLENVSMMLPGGKTTVLFGKNGAGKSTVAHLFLGLLVPKQGRVLLGETPYTELDMAWFRSNVSYVPQNPVVFPASIRENITYGLGSISEDRIEAALSLAEALDFVHSLPEGLESQVGHRGLQLSGGERQRILLARAFVRMPAFLLLDEPFTYLDPTAIPPFLETLGNLEPHPTILLITHGEFPVDAAYNVEELVPRTVRPAGAGTVYRR